MTSHSIFIPGIPEGQGRPRFDGHHFYSPKSDWYKSVLNSARKNPIDNPLQGPLRVQITFFMPRPKSKPQWLEWCPQKPDMDNAEKATYDALTQAGWWEDDKQLVWTENRKMYVQINQSPGAHIRVEVLREMKP